MKLLVAKGATNARGQTFDVSWQQFKDLVRDHNVARTREDEDEKKDAPWFSTIHYRNSHRRRENIIGPPWTVVIDLDSIRDPRAIEKALERWEYIAWTTWKSKPEAQRWRVVIPIEGRIATERYGDLVRRIVGPIGAAAKVDDRSFLPEQLWFLPWHPKSGHRHHRIWENHGSWIRSGELIQVDFTNVKLATRPEEIDEGERNNSLILRLQEPDALRAEDEQALLEIALAWNDRLKSPMKLKEVRQTVHKKWRWMHRGEGLQMRADAWKKAIRPEDLPEVGVGLMSNEIRTAQAPESIIGDFLYPGATMITAKMKEGKSFLAMQIALSAASGTKFLNGSNFPGFEVKKKVKAVLIGGEDTPGAVRDRFLGSITAGHLPSVAVRDVLMLFNDDLDKVRAAQPQVPGLVLFENLVDRWYSQGYRIIAIDPLRVLEAALAIAEYPGTVSGMNLHARDFLTTRFYTRVAQKYEDLCILISMHHGKNKKGQDASDPGDMIAGTTGFGAGAITTIALLPVAPQLEAEVNAEGEAPKRRELYIHGRHTREKRLLIEQSLTTGVWQALGRVSDEVTTQARRAYFEALIELGAKEKYVGAEVVARKVGRTTPQTVRMVMARAQRSGQTYMGWRLVIKRGPNGGYRLTGGGGEGDD